MLKIKELFSDKNYRSILLSAGICFVVIIVSISISLVYTTVISISPKSDASVVSNSTITNNINTLSKNDPENEYYPENIGKYSYDSLGRPINPLTGLQQQEATTTRPVAVMINNIQQAIPQMGISQGDIIYECKVEGGITRLMMLINDCSQLSEPLGSIRSCREYYLDFAANHNAIYVHAGGSNQAYIEIRDRSINNLDGVNMYLPNSFYRDQTRMSTMGYEHSLMITGEGIISGIEYCGYNTSIDDSFTSPLVFNRYDKNAENAGQNTALYVSIPDYTSNSPWYEYDLESKTYLRFQYGQEHIDGATDEQLSFTNILILGCTHTYLNDEKNHIDVDLTGSGKGYYISNGTYCEITWEKDSPDAPISFYTSTNDQLSINPGKTIINIVSDGMLSDPIESFISDSPITSAE